MVNLVHNGPVWAIVAVHSNSNSTAGLFTVLMSVVKSVGTRDEKSKVEFCSVQVCSVGYEISHRAYGIFRYRYGSHAEHAEPAGYGTVWRLFSNAHQQPGISTRVHPYPGSRWKILADPAQVAGTGMRRLQIAQNCQ